MPAHSVVFKHANTLLHRLLMDRPCHWSFKHSQHFCYFSCQSRSWICIYGVKILHGHIVCWCNCWIASGENFACYSRGMLNAGWILLLMRTTTFKRSSWETEWGGQKKKQVDPVLGSLSQQSWWNTKENSKQKKIPQGLREKWSQTSLVFV